MAVLSPQARMRAKIEDIFKEGESSLQKLVADKKLMAHVGIDWQRLYCDPDFEANPHRCKNCVTIQQALGLMRATINELRPLMPSLWITHDIKIRDRYLDDDNEAFNLEGNDLNRKLDALRIQSQQMCLPVHAGEPVIPKLHHCGFEGTTLHQQLQEKQIEVVMLSGVLRSVCVKKSGLTAKFLGYDTYIAEDLTADETQYPLAHYARDLMERAEKGLKMVRIQNALKILKGVQP
ncbi:MAG: isochorismatase family protein [Micavibrio sp.]